MKLSFSAAAVAMTVGPAAAAVVYQTAWNTYFVTVGSDGQIASSETTVPSSVATVVTVEASGHTHSALNYDFSPETISVTQTSSSSSEPLTSSTTPSVTTSEEEPASTSTSTSTSTSPSPATSTSTAAAATTSAATSSGTSSSGLSSFAQSIVDYHNKIRSEHDVGDLVWNDEIADYAQSYLSGDNCVFKHSGGPYGENIALGYSTPEAACAAWADEVKDYNFASPGFSENTGHFTQMVWKATTSVGCAQQSCSSGEFIVCEYLPRGNIIGYFEQNVLN